LEVLPAKHGRLLLELGVSPLRHAGHIMKFKLFAVIKNDLSRKGAANLPTLEGMNKDPVVFKPFLIGDKGHFQPVVIAGKTPGFKPVVGGDMKGHLIEFMKLSIHKKGVFGTKP
jgi:hypothetical protein